MALTERGPVGSRWHPGRGGSSDAARDCKWVVTSPLAGSLLHGESECVCERERERESVCV